MRRVRLVETLEAASVIAAEDTRVTIQLLRALGIENRPRLVALHDHNEREKAAELVELARDADVARAERRRHADRVRPRLPPRATPRSPRASRSPRSPARRRC